MTWQFYHCLLGRLAGRLVDFSSVGNQRTDWWTYESRERWRPRCRRRIHLMNSNKLRPHLEVAQGLVTRTDWRQICMCVRAPSRGLVEKWGYLASLSSTWSSSSVICLEIYSLAPSNKPFQFSVLHCRAHIKKKKKKKIYLDEQYVPLGE